MTLSNRFHSFVPILLVSVGGLVCPDRALAAPALPVINTNNNVNITNFGAISSTLLTNTTAIQNAINSAATTNGGCTVEIPAGTFISGPLTLKSGVNLQMDSGALLQMLPMASWPNASTDFILGSGLHDVEISGPGTIDGQGAAWWGPPTAGTRPNFIEFKTSNRILIQDVTLQNPPTFHIMIKNNNLNITVQRITINTPGTSPNTDGFDIASTNVLIQDCFISDGDDNVEIGGSSPAAFITITNCTFGTGHGVSIGSITSGGVSNLVVANCTFNGTDYGIRLKSDNNALGNSGAGGICQNLSYSNIGMTNIIHGAIVIYSYYSEFGTPTSITPATAAAQTVDPVTSTTVIWRNITISNVNATVIGSGIGGIIWGRIEMPVTNLTLSQITISAPKTFEVYNVRNFQFLNPKITVPNGSSTFTLFNAQMNLTNGVFATNLVTFDGLTTNGLGNTLGLYNARASLKNTNAFDDGPLTLADSLLTISNNFMLFPGTVLNYTLDPNTNRVAVVGNLALGGTVNLTNGAGFGPGTYTLLTYTGTLSGSTPTLGTTPAGGYNFSLDTSIAGQVNLIVTSPAPSAPTNLVAAGTNLLINLKWNAVAGATSYNLKRGVTDGGPYPTVYSGLVATNYADAAVTNTVTYYYVVTAVSGGESTNSLQASATPLPSALATNIVAQVNGGQLQLSWPQDHQGWHLQMQTNDVGTGLTANWVDVPNTTATNQVVIPVDPANGSVFLRLTYP